MDTPKQVIHSGSRHRIELNGMYAQQMTGVLILQKLPVSTSEEQVRSLRPPSLMPPLCKPATERRRH
jgi:hypothetical protein